MMKFFLLSLLCMSILISACSGGKKAANRELSFAPGPHVLVYKTTQDYSQQVPVTLSPDGKRIVSYPSPKDLRRGDQLATPLALDKGYWVDQRGIGPQVAFTSYTYVEYVDFIEAPSLDQLMAAVIDKKPIVEMCDCGLISQYNDLEKELNELISADLSPCKRLVGSGQ